MDLPGETQESTISLKATWIAGFKGFGVNGKLEQLVFQLLLMG